MDMIAQTFGNILQDNSSLLVAVLVFLATGTTAFSAMAFARVRGSVKKRATGILDDDERRTRPTRSLRYTSLRAATKLLEYTTKHYSGTDDDGMKVLRRRLVQAGIYDPRGVAFFFIARTTLAVALGLGLFLTLPLVTSHGGTFLWLMVIVGGVAGYIGPSMYLDRRIAS